jgi:ParB family transcriptional regulator, chromosome partitioning protein
VKAIDYRQELPVDKIRVSPFHFRKETIREHLDDLASSIAENGLIHAISVVKTPGGGYELINGHRRLLATKLGGFKTIRTNIYEYEPHELKDLRIQQQAVVKFLLAANSSEPLIPVERAHYYAEAMEKFGWEPKDIARVHHVTETSVIDDLMFLSPTK